MYFFFRKECPQNRSDLIVVAVVDVVVFKCFFVFKCLFLFIFYFANSVGSYQNKILPTKKYSAYVPQKRSRNKPKHL